MHEIYFDKDVFGAYFDWVQLGTDPFTYDSNMENFFMVDSESLGRLETAERVFGLVNENFVHTFHNSELIKKNWERYGNYKSALKTFRDGNGVCLDLAVLYNTALKINGIGGAVVSVNCGKHAISSLDMGDKIIFVDPSMPDGFGCNVGGFEKYMNFRDSCSSEKYAAYKCSHNHRHNNSRYFLKLLCWSLLLGFVWHKYHDEFVAQYNVLEKDFCQHIIKHSSPLKDNEKDIAFEWCRDKYGPLVYDKSKL